MRHQPTIAPGGQRRDANQADPALTLLAALDTAEIDLAAEWLEPDGSGGFASGTVGLVRTRRYHALLLTTDSCGGRYVLVNGVEAWVKTPTVFAAITTQAYLGGALFPNGQGHLREFRPNPFPTWYYELPDGTTIEFSLFCALREAETVLRWTVDRSVDIIVRPLLSGRDYHALHRENGEFHFASNSVAGARIWKPYPGVPAVAARGDFAWKDDPVWYRHFDYSEERERGLDNGEDLASPGLFTWHSVRQATLAFRADAPGSRPLLELAKAERTRRSRPPRYVAADAYLARRSERSTVLAGFPWFADWGRDTFIAIRGLLIGRGQWREALAVLLAWSGHVSHGMLPNRFPDAGTTPEYNSVDASLWFVIAVYELLAGGQVKVPDAQELRNASLAVLEGYVAGTRFGIGLDPADGLVQAGIPGVQLTWMDAKIGDHVVTPRIGKPVEVQALWINALSAAGSWPGGERWRSLAAQARQSLAELFPDPASGGLIDVLNAPDMPDGRDSRIRPNQILAAGGLPFPAVGPELRSGIVAVVERELLTPLGLRTLAPGDPEYRGHYTGGPAARDGAYHQGTAWPWLLGPFVAAWLDVRGATEATRAEARRRFLAPLQAHLAVAGLGHVSEVVDGDQPHRPGGCPFQAWSLGELIRIEAMLAEPGGPE